MTDPKRAEPNEHAERLLSLEEPFSRLMIKCVPGDPDAILPAKALRAAAAEIERLAARVRELESEKVSSFDKWRPEPQGPQS